MTGTTAFCAAPLLRVDARSARLQRRAVTTMREGQEKSQEKSQARTAVVTGASGGIGLETCKGLASRLPKLERLILCGRDMPKTERVARQLRDAHAHNGLQVHTVQVDLADGGSVVRCANRVQHVLQGASLDLLVCNAGVMACPRLFARAPIIDKGTGGDTTDVLQIELQFFVNHLSHAMLSSLLLPALRDGDGGRVVFVSSLAAALSRSRVSAPRVMDKLRDDKARYERWPAYAESKLCMTLFARALAEREEGRVEAISLHPGVVKTELARHLVPSWMGGAAMAHQDASESWLGMVARRAFGLLTPTEGAALSLHVACAPRGALRNGRMYETVRGKLVSERLVPLLKDRAECAKVYEDALQFCERVVQGAGDASGIEAHVDK